MTDSLSNFHFVHINNKAEKTLFLLHGTGADEYDLLPLVDHLKDKYNFLGIRGNISQQGMTRFFRRDDQGVFDLENIKEETKKLSEFIAAWCTKHILTPQDISFLGFSNGANMILATVLLYPETISKAVLLHSMIPIPVPSVDLSGKSFLVTYGVNDHMIPFVESAKVPRVLRDTGAQVETIEHNGGHGIEKSEVIAFREFLM